MTYRLLIDECLSVELVQIAIAAGHVESTCVRDRGMLGSPDHVVGAWAIENDFTLVTRNSYDFRGRGADSPGGYYGHQEVHPGLICLNTAGAFGIEEQGELFRLALSEIAERSDLINTALEVLEEEDGSVYIDVYPIPAPAEESSAPPPAGSCGPK